MVYPHPVGASASARNILRAIIVFFFMSITVGIMFHLLGAVYAAILQIFVYGGFVLVLLLVTFHTIGRQ